MKTSLFLLAVVTSLMPTLTMGLVGISWGVSNVPSSGLKDISFPFSIANAPRKTGYYFAQQFNFVGQNDVGYTGLQPRPDANGQHIIRAVFSSFIAGTTTSDTNCHMGADGGPGVSCAVEFYGSYANAYTLEIRNTAGTTWEGTAVDAVTGHGVHVGTYTLPAGTQGIRNGQAGFVEYYLWNDGQQHACSSLPYTSAAFGVPRTSTHGAVGSLTDAFEYGNCVGQVAFRNQRTTFGVDVGVGFANSALFAQDTSSY